MKALFDLSFTRFIAPSIAKIVYILIMVLVAIGYLFMVVVAFRAGTGFGLFTLLILGPLFALIYLVLARVAIEALIASIRTAENTGELVRLSGGRPPQSGPMSDPHGPYGRPPQPSSEPPTGPEAPYQQQPQAPSGGRDGFPDAPARGPQTP